MLVVTANGFHHPILFVDPLEACPIGDRMIHNSRKAAVHIGRRWNTFA
jgi:hypothetical protein